MICLWATAVGDWLTLSLLRDNVAKFGNTPSGTVCEFYVLLSLVVKFLNAVVMSNSQDSDEATFFVT